MQDRIYKNNELLTEKLIAEIITEQRAEQATKELLQSLRDTLSGPYSLPCGKECTWPDCDDEITQNGQRCMARKINSSLKIVNQMI